MGDSRWNRQERKHSVGGRGARRVALLLVVCTGLHPGVLPALAQEGDPDPTFSSDGRAYVTWGAEARSTAVEAFGNGKLLVAGALGAGPNVFDEWAVMLLGPTGLPDLLWSGSFVPFDFAADGSDAVGPILDLRRDASERTLLAGSVLVSGQDSDIVPALARLTASGELDPTFSGNGLQVIPVPAGWYLNSIAAAEILPDGRAYFVGTCQSCSPGGGVSAFALRTSANGNPDPSFSFDGWTTFSLVVADLTFGRALRTDTAGKLTVACAGFNNGADWSSVLVRFDAIGQLDVAFGGGDGVGNLLGPLEGLPTDLEIDRGSGQIYLSIGSSFDIANGGIAGFTGNGSVRSDFGVNGLVDLDLEEGATVSAIEIQDDGKVVAAGTINATGTQPAGFFVARLLPSGALDSSYDGNGVNRIELDRTAEAVDRSYAATLSAGRLVAVGSAAHISLEDAFAVVRVESALIFADGFNQGNAARWPGN